MATYELRIHTRDVSITESGLGDIGKHTGYDLITTNEDGSQTIQYIDLYEQNGKINFYISSASISVIEYTLTSKDGGNRNIKWGSKTFQNGQLIDTTEDYLETYQAYTGTLISGSAALAVFNKIKLEATMLSQLKNNLTYNSLDRNCNTSTNYFSEQYLNGQNVFNGLPDVIYRGAEDSFYAPNSSSTTDITIKSVREILDKYYSLVGSNVDLSDVQYGIVNQSDSWYAKFTTNNYNYVFAGNGNPNIVDIYGNSFIYATSGNNTISAGNGNDRVYGRESNIIDGGDGNDIIYAGDQTYAAHTIGGGAGDDYIYAGHGGDDVRGGSGKNTVYLGTGSDKYTGGDDVDIVDGGSANFEFTDSEDNSFKYNLSADFSGDINEIHLGGGNDKYTGGIGIDKVWSGSGNDIIDTGDGNDKVYTTDGSAEDTNTVNLGAGNDSFEGGIGKDIVHGGDNNDFIEGGDGENQLYGDAGDDYLYGGKDNDIIDGGDDNDHIYGYDGLNKLSGGAGNDHIYGGKDKDIIYTGSGENVVRAYEGNDEVYTNDGSTPDDKNEIYLGSGVNKFVGGSGRDKVYNDNASDETSDIKLGRGRDYFSGGAGKDVVYGGSGNDTIHGGNGKNQLFGEAGDDAIYGGDDNDTINGGAGADTIDAGFGNNIINVGKDNYHDYVYIYNVAGAVDHVYCSKPNDEVRVFGTNNIYSHGKDLIIESSRGNKAILHDRAENEPDPDNPEYPKITDENGNVWLPNEDGIWEPHPDGAASNRPDLDQEKLKELVEQDKFDPIVVDLDGNGIEMLPANGNYFFDLNGDSIGEEIDWVSGNDGFLVHDTNNNGQVDGIDELFGNASIDGFEELSSFDTNGDGVVNNLDENFSQIKVWQDLNGNNVSDAGELKTLDEVGIEEFVLSGHGKETNVYNSIIEKIGHIVKTDGSTADMADIFFQTNTNANIWTGDPVEISPEVSEMPYIKGMGMLPNLHIAAMLDENLKNILQDINTLSMQDANQFLQKTTDLINRWCGVDNMSDTEMAGQLSKKMVTILSKISGFTTLTNVRLVTTANQFQQLYMDFYNKVVQNLLVQTYLSKFENYTGHVSKNSGVILASAVEDFSALMEEVKQINIENNPLLTFNLFKAINEINNFHPIDESTFRTGITSWLQNTSMVDMTEGLINDSYKVISGSIEDLSDNTSYIIYGIPGVDNVVLGNTNNFIETGDGSDVIQLGNGNNNINSGNDSDRITVGDGDNTINAGNGNNTIKTGSGNNTINAGNGADTITTGNGNNNIVSGAGNDIITAGSGDDLIIAGSGNDTIYGGSGANVYKFEAGFGHDILNNFEGFDIPEDTQNKADIIEFGEGINAADVQMTRNYLDLILTIGNDKLTITNYFSEGGDSSYTVNEIKFADGTIWTYDQIRVMWNAAGNSGQGLILTGDNDNNTLNGSSGSDVIYGKDGNDIISAQDGNDIISGGKGNDTIELGAGDDHLYYNLGDGFDTISDYGNNDTIFFGPGISFSDLKFAYIDSALRITIKDNPNQGLLIKNFFSTNLRYKIEEIVFADGSQYHLSDMGLTLTQDSHGETIGDTPFSDTILAGAGFDTVNASDGDDILIGGTGNDNLNGGKGNDTYIYNIGDGLDTIEDYEGSSTLGRNDKIKFGPGISADNITLTQKGNNLVITLFSDITQGIEIKSFFYNDYYKIEKLEFADGSTLDLTHGLTLHQPDTNENITGTYYDDVIYGNGGNDTINGGNGNDILIGGKGNDTLNGGSGDDTYIWNLGDGLDTISDSSGNNIVQFGEGITLENLTFERENGTGYDLHVFVNGDQNQGINLDNFFNSSAWQNVTLKFADGSTFVPKDSGFNFTLQEGLTNLSAYSYSNTLTGNSQDNSISGANGNDTLIGGKGNDTLDGWVGDDTYIWNLGDGLDTISDSSGNNIVQFGEGITLENLTFERENGTGYDLYIFVNGDRSQGINLDNFFNSSAWQNVTFKFADGSTFVPKDSGFNFTLREGQTNLSAYSYSNTLTGNTQDNRINGANGNDTLIGGKGNDILDGGNGDDTYVWNLGDGFDTISDSSGNNSVQFGEGITLENLTFERENGTGYDLYIFVNGDRSQGINLDNFFNSSAWQNVTFKFADGSTFVPKDSGFNFTLREGQTNLDGYSFNDILKGNSQDNTISGTSGNDTLIGGKGNDTLNGGSGDDTYIWNLGDGFDTISDSSGNNIVQFGEGITLENLTFERENGTGYDLYIFVNGDRNQGINLDYFYNSSAWQNVTLKFADGSTLPLTTDIPLSQLPNINQTINGTNDDDILTGGDGNDIINAQDGYNDITGGKGNDTITGGNDRDTYYYNLGDGHDTVTDPHGKDQIIFGEGISKENLSFKRLNNDLWLVINNDLSQGIKIVNFFYSNDNKIETLKFADGTSMNIATSGLTLQQWENNDNITGTPYNDTIYGNNGQDTLAGGSGHDTLIGGLGNDILKGGIGDDTYVWNLGDGFDTIEDDSGQNIIELGENISLNNLSFTKIGENLYIQVNNNPSEGFNLSKFFKSDSYKNYKLKFKDGTEFALNENGLNLNQGDSTDTIYGTSFNDVIHANDGNDTIYAYAGNDILYGGKGNDTIDAGTGDDIIEGGQGNDSLQGGNGDDTYIYNLGDGFDTISDSDGNDKIVLGAGITADMLSYSREENNLKIIINNDNLQGFILKDHFTSLTSRIESLEFSDGSILSLINKGFTFDQSNTDETTSGTSYNDTIYAKDGNDTINAGDGNDTLIGGQGNDSLKGGNGDDTYIYNLGDGFDTITETSGNDTIVLGAGISLENLRFIREANNLRILINNDITQGFLLVDQFQGTDNMIEQIQFADNSVLDLVNDSLTFEQYEGNESISGTGNDDIIYGKGGNDTISTGDGDDILIGGKGNDTLNGGYGRDTYIYNLGDGMDIINETQGKDKIKFGEGITIDDLKFTQEGKNLKITIANDPDQSILINNFYNGTQYQIENLQFANGSTFNLSTQGLTLTQTNGDETIDGTIYNDIIYGNDGHDTISSGNGNDILIGGLGNDMLYGGTGDDTYIYNMGDGFDTISENGGNDKIVFGEGINRNDLSFEKIGNHLKISINGDEVKGVQINNQFTTTDANKVETIEFHDGTTLDISNAYQLIQAMSTFSAAQGASDTALSNPTQDVSEMYSLAANNSLTNKAI